MYTWLASAPSCAGESWLLFSGLTLEFYDRSVFLFFSEHTYLMNYFWTIFYAQNSAKGRLVLNLQFFKAFKLEDATISSAVVPGIKLINPFYFPNEAQD